MSVTSKVVETAVEIAMRAIAAALKGLTAGQKAQALDKVSERAAFDARQQRRLDARRKARG